MEVENKYPKYARVTPGKGVEFDGVEIPWYMLEDPPVRIAIGSRSCLTHITISIPVERVEIVGQAEN